MKKVLIPVVVLVLLAGGGGAFFLLGGDKSKTDDATHSELAEGENHIYLKLDPITGTIFRDQQPAGVFTAAVTLELAEESLRSEVFRARRRLRDAMFRELHAMFEREEYSGRKVDVDAVKQRMLVVSRRELGDEMILDVFVSTLMRKGA